MLFEPRRRRRPVGLTSLIDVIFLLLLFFMLASSFTRYQALEIAGGGNAGGAAVRPAYLRLHSAGTLDLNGLPLQPAELPAALAALKQDMIVAIWSGPEASVQDVVDAMSAARQSDRRTVLVTGH
jgi:biopolymer transport protein ExbD